LLEAKAPTSGRKSGVTCAPSLAALCAQTKALKPVMSRPTKSVWIVSVPSYV
jgi:hypothetical protein